MRALVFFIALVASASAHAEPKFFTRDVTSQDDCHREYDALAGDWRHHPWFQLQVTPQGREHVLNCLPDGVEEFVCNPSTRKLVVAIDAGHTEAACRTFTPSLPIRGRMLPR